MNWVTEADVNGFRAGDSGTEAALVQGYGVLRIGMGCCHAPGDFSIMPKNMDRDACGSCTDQGKIRGFNAGQVPLARNLKTQMRVVGQNGLAAFGSSAAQNPGI